MSLTSEPAGSNAPLFAAGALIAHKYVDKFNVDEKTVKKALAILLGARPLVEFLTGQAKEVDPISAGAAPIAIAGDMLDIASFNDASTAAFGGTLCNNLTTATKDIIGNKSDVQALPIFWAATMFAALYKGYGSHWHVAAYAAARAKSVADGVEAKKLPLAETPIFLVCAWAVYQTFVKNTNKMPLVSKGIMLGEAAHSGWKLIVRLLKTGQKKLG